MSQLVEPQIRIEDRLRSPEKSIKFKARIDANYIDAKMIGEVFLGARQKLTASRDMAHVVWVIWLDGGGDFVVVHELFFWSGAF